MAALGELVDMLSKQDLEIKKAQRVVDKLKRKRAQIEERAIRAFEKQRSTKVSGTSSGALGTKMVKQALSIKESGKFFDYVKKHNAFDLFQRRINSKAYFDRREEGEVVPGIGIFEKTYIRITQKRD